MLDHGKKIQQAFDNAAGTYDEYAELQNHSGTELIKRLPNTNFNRVIDLGCGTGIITEKLTKLCSYEKFLAIDTSIMSLAIARQRLSQPNVVINNMNFDVSLPSAEQFDLVFANMSLHWSFDFEALLKRIYDCMAPKGVLVFSIPLADTFKELMPHFAVNNFHTSEEVLYTLHASQFHIGESEQDTVTMRFPDTISTLRYIKRIGAHHVTTRRYTGLYGKNAINALDIQQLTYQLGYFVVSKPE